MYAYYSIYYQFNEQTPEAYILLALLSQICSLLMLLQGGRRTSLRSLAHHS